MQRIANHESACGSHPAILIHRLRRRADVLSRSLSRNYDRAYPSSSRRNAKVIQSIKEKTMYTRMLIPLDGSKLAENVLPYARALAGALNARIELLSVVESVDFAGQVRSLDPMSKAAVREGERYLEGVARSFTGSEVTCVVEEGEAEKIIIEKAGRDKETLDRHGHPRPLGNPPLADGQCRREGAARRH